MKTYLLTIFFNNYSPIGYVFSIPFFASKKS